MDIVKSFFKIVKKKKKNREYAVCIIVGGTLLLGKLAFKKEKKKFLSQIETWIKVEQVFCYFLPMIMLNY